MMRKIVEQFVKYPFYANMIILVLILGGSLGLLNMKKSFFPEFSTKDIYVSVAYPGASPKEMEEGITVRIEEAIRGIAGIKEINSTSSENFANVQITITGEYDIDETLMEIKNAVDGITSFPVDAEKPIVFKRRASTFAFFMGLSGDVDIMTLKKYAQRVEDDLYASGIMSQINIGGYPNLELSVEVTEDNLMRYNLTFDEIARAISLNNRDVSAGMIKSTEEEVLIQSRYRTVKPEEIADIIVRANNDGTYLRIRDIGTVKKQFADVAGVSYMNGERSVSIQVFKLPEEDLVEISDFCNAYIKEFNQKNPDVQLYATYDFLIMLGARLNLLYKNGAIGLVLIFVVLGLFLSLRLSGWVAWGIPASFLGMFLVASMFGITINMISLFGMILVVGILVDDGIVIAENIYSHWEMGKTPKKAAVDGTMEVLPAVVTSITTTIVAFLPLFFIEGRMEFMYEMGFVVVASLAFSLVEAFMVLPGHIGTDVILRSRERKSIGVTIRKTLDKGVDFLRSRLYGKVLRLMIKWKWIVAVMPIALIMLTAGMFEGRLIKSTFFPSIPFDQFNIDIAFKPGSGERQTLEFLQRFDQAIWDVNAELQEELNDTDDFVNYTFVSTGSGFNGQETGSHAGNVFVLLRNLENSGTTSYEIVNRVSEKIGEVPEAEKFTIAGRNTFGTPVSVSLLGKDPEALDKAKYELISGMKTMTDLKNITDNNSLGKREIRLKLKPKAYYLGLDQVSLASQVRQGFFGGQAQRLQEGKDELRVWVRYPKTDRISIGQLENMKVKTALGYYPLSELADYNIERGPVNIKRFNGSREVRITADLVNQMDPVPPLLEKIRNEILPPILQKYPSVKVEYQGQQRDSDETTSQMMSYFGLAFLVMVLLIMIHFKSFTQALIIVMMIPLAWLGSAWGHGIEGFPVSLLSAWGMLALSGVIINDAVVFLSKYNSLLLEGNTVKEAVYKAGIARFRPIVLTTLTTTVGLYPLILETSFQAQFLVPMAISLAYGVFVGTAFILIFFPIIILILNDIKRVAKWVFSKDLDALPAPEEVEKAVIYSKRSIE